MSEAERINELTARCVNAEAKLSALQTRFDELLAAAERYAVREVQPTYASACDCAECLFHKAIARAKQPAGEKSET